VEKIKTKYSYEQKLRKTRLYSSRYVL